MADTDAVIAVGGRTHTVVHRTKYKISRVLIDGGSGGIFNARDSSSEARP